MNLWTAVVAIMAILAIAEVSKNWMKIRSEKKNSGNASTENEQIKALESRIQTLETIVTDGREKLKRQIDDI